MIEETENNYYSTFHYYAEIYASKLGISVFSLRPNSKKPATANGFKDATKDVRKIRQMWKENPQANIGAATGKVSGIEVLDFDAKPSVQETLQNFVNIYGTIPNTVCAKSGGGGFHCFYRPKEPLSCRVGIVTGVDWRGDGGYIVLPPSIHDKTGHPYAWVEGLSIWEFPLLETPSWLAEVVQKHKVSKIKTSSKTFRGEIIGGLKDGSRNHTLTRLTGYLFGKRISPFLVSDLIHSINEAKCDPPLDEKDVSRIIESIAGSELEKRQQRGIR